MCTKNILPSGLAKRISPSLAEHSGTKKAGHGAEKAIDGINSTWSQTERGTDSKTWIRFTLDKVRVPEKVSIQLFSGTKR